MVEYRHEPGSGRYWLMEVNGRFWGSQPLAWHCGAHFAWESYRRSVLGQGDAAPAPRDAPRRDDYRGDDGRRDGYRGDDDRHKDKRYRKRGLLGDLFDFD